MALISCPECGNGVSNEAEICPHCSYPVGKNVKRRWYPLIGAIIFFVMIILVIVKLSKMIK